MTSMNLAPDRARRADWKSVLVIGAHVTLVVATVAMAAAVDPVWRPVLFWLSFGLLGYGLTNLMHEAAHRLLFGNRNADDRRGQDDDTKDASLVRIRGWPVVGLMTGCLFLKNAGHMARVLSAAGRQVSRVAP